jgi:hypothetical protein
MRKFGDRLGILGVRMDVQHPQFLKLGRVKSSEVSEASTLGRVKSSILHGAWRFHFFPNSFFAKIRLH